MLHCYRISRQLKKDVILGVTQRMKTTFGTRASLTRPWSHIGIQ